MGAGGPTRETTRPIRLIPAVFAPLIGILGAGLIVLADATDAWFAWTILPPVSAAFAGTTYAASAFMYWGLGRERVWANARVAWLGVLLFSAGTGIASLIHLDRFHLSGPNLIAQFVAVSWLVIYVTHPVAGTVALVDQVRRPGVDPARTSRLAPWYRASWAVLGVPMTVVGVLLFLLMPAAVDLWPWQLTPFMARVTGAMLIGIGTIAVSAAWEDDAVRIRPAAIGFAAFGLLQAAAVLRDPGSVAFASVGFVVYAIWSVAVAAVGLYGWRRASG